MSLYACSAVYYEKIEGEFTREREKKKYVYVSLADAGDEGQPLITKAEPPHDQLCVTRGHKLIQIYKRVSTTTKRGRLFLCHSFHHSIYIYRFCSEREGRLIIIEEGHTQRLCDDVIDWRTDDFITPSTAMTLLLKRMAVFCSLASHQTYCIVLFFCCSTEPVSSLCL